jgi:hypothetical protein
MIIFLALQLSNKIYTIFEEYLMEENNSISDSQTKRKESSNPEKQTSKRIKVDNKSVDNIPDSQSSYTFLQDILAESDCRILDSLTDSFSSISNQSVQDIRENTHSNLLFSANTNVSFPNDEEPDTSVSHFSDKIEFLNTSNEVKSEDEQHLSEEESADESDNSDEESINKDDKVYTINLTNN